MQLNDAQTKKLLEYKGQAQIRQLSLNLALTRLKGIYRADPSPAALARCAAELNAVLNKFSVIMKPDYEWIIQL
jgi:hypothetical protein